MKHVLFVAFHYPPEASSSGVLRTLKYSRYLQEYGWRVTVVTPQIDAFEVIDPALELQIPPSVRVIRTRYLNTKRHLSLLGRYPAILAFPDRWLGWLPWAVAAGRRVLEDDPFDLIYSTNPHATAHLIAWRLANLSGKPWVADFRDPWFEEESEVGAKEPGSFPGLKRRLEAGVVRRCSHVVASTNNLRDTLQKRYGGHADKITAILNGYDEADFGSLPASVGKNERMTIVHAGIINPEFRDPRPLFRALRHAADAGSLDPQSICVRFIGAGAFGESEAMRQSLAETALTECVEFRPRVAYEQALIEIAKADLLLLLQASEDTVGLVPAKLYEYLRSQKPVLALVYPGSAEEVLDMTGGGWAVDPRQVDVLTSAVTRCYRYWTDQTLDSVRASMESLHHFDRRALTGALAAKFDRLTEQHRNK